MSLSRRRHFLRQPPGIAVLFQLVHDIIGNPIAFFFGQFLAQAAHKFTRTPQRESDGKTQQIAAGTHIICEQKENKIVNGSRPSLNHALR
jgi:hypothetical protein